MRKCKSCGERKPDEDFYYGSNFARPCRKCFAERTRNDRAKKKKRDPVGVSVAIRENNLKTRYGIDLVDYEEMLDNQGGVCLICAVMPEPGSRLHVDHNHDTGEVRALLCMKCNTAIGKLKSPGALRRAADYLERHKS